MERGRGRRGEVRKGIVIGGIALLLVFGCNNGGESTAEKGLSEIIASSKQLFLDAFVTFGDFLLKDIFGVTSTTAKKAVGEHLGKIGAEVSLLKNKLEGIKSDENYNLIKDKADGVINKSIETLKNIVEGTDKIKQATDNANDPIGGNATDAEDANPANTDSVKNLIAGINMIFEAANDAKISASGNANKEIEDSKEVGNLFQGNSNVSKAKALGGANRAVIAASGADILAAIAAVKDNTGKGAGNIENATNAYEIAVANNKNSNDITDNVKKNASAIAAGLALKAMAKEGKLSTHNTHAKGKEVNAVLIGVVDKTVNEIVFTIRRTVEQCLKNVNNCIKENSSSEVKSK